MNTGNINEVYLFSSSGRSGSRLLNQALCRSPITIPCFHEYDIGFLKRAIVSYLDGETTRSELQSLIVESFSRVRDPFIDCSYLYAYIPDVIRDIDFPFKLVQIHITRHPIEIVRSWVQKLGSEIYPANRLRDIRSLNLRQESHPNQRSLYWPQIPSWLLVKDDCLVEKVCYHYLATNIPIIRYNLHTDVNRIPVVSLEELVTLRKDCGIPGVIVDALSRTTLDLKRPLNIVKPFTSELLPEEYATIKRLCGAVGEALGYTFDG